MTRARRVRRRSRRLVRLWRRQVGVGADGVPNELFRELDTPTPKLKDSGEASGGGDGTDLALAGRVMELASVFHSHVANAKMPPW